MQKRALVSSVELRRVLRNSPALPALLQRLHPKIIGRLISEVGLQDAAELMALTPRKKLLAVLDESIWRSPAPGTDEALDVCELVNWLEIWIDVGETFLVECLANMSDEYLTQCMAHLIRVDDEDALAYSRGDSDSNDEGEELEGGGDDGQCDRFGPYLVRSAITDESDIVRAVLHALWSDAQDRLLRILATLSARESMLTRRDSHVSLDHDMAFARQLHREHQGYVTASGARAFLAVGTTASLEELFILAEYDNESRRYLKGNHSTAGQHNPVTVSDAEENEVDPEATIDPSPTTTEFPQDRQLGHELDSDAAQELQSLLQYLQPLSPPTQFLLEQRDNRRQLPLLKLLDRLATDDSNAFEQRERELAYLANVVMGALRSNTAPLEPTGARSMAIATCNLGLELLSARRLPANLEREPGLLRLFLVGWRALNELHERIRHAFERGAAVSKPSARERRWFNEQVEVGLRDLARSLAQRDFAAAREAAILLSIAFDRSSCLAIALLLDEIPRFPTRLEGATQPHGARWLESIDDLNRVAALLANLTFKS